MTKAIRMIDAFGAPRDRGRAYGRACKNEIHATLAFYRETLLAGAGDLRPRSAMHLAALDAADASLGEELRAVAEHADVDPLDLVALNARSETMSGMECTSLGFPRTGVLGQTWDWRKKLIPLMRLLRVEEEDGHRIIMLVEPGMIGKMGMNSSGVAVCINFLWGSRPTPPGVPFHVLARIALRQRSADEAIAAVLAHAGSATGHMLIADPLKMANVELDGPSFSVVRSEAAPLPHANGYVHISGVPLDPLRRLNSWVRLQRVRRFAARAGGDVGDLRTLLEDSRRPFPINVRHNGLLGDAANGTNAILIMDTKERTLYVRRSDAPSYAWQHGPV